MKQKKTRRPAVTGNGARFTSLRIILADVRLQNKIYLAIMRGSVLGAVLAVIYGIMHTETSILEGAIIAGVGFLWLGIFYLINPDDKLFGGAK